MTPQVGKDGMTLPLTGKLSKPSDSGSICIISPLTQEPPWSNNKLQTLSMQDQPAFQLKDVTPLISVPSQKNQFSTETSTFVSLVSKQKLNPTISTTWSLANLHSIQDQSFQRNGTCLLLLPQEPFLSSTFCMPVACAAVHPLVVLRAIKWPLLIPRITWRIVSMILQLRP